MESIATNEKRSAALSSVVAALFLTGMKLVVGTKTNSLGILSEAAHSGLDLVAAIVTYVAVTLADKPPDKEHQYGHGKIENLSALAETLLLVVTCAWIIGEAVRRLISKDVHIEATVWSFVVVVVAIAVDISRSRMLTRVAKKYHSQALEADALHFSSDVWSSLVVLVGLGCVAFGFPEVDSVAAIVVAFLVLFVSYRLGRRTIDALIDRVPSGLYEKTLQAIQSVDGVEDVRTIRLRPSGARVFVDTTVAVKRTLPFEQAHSIMDKIERAVETQYPNADVVVHAEPLESEDETIADKVRMIVLKKGLSAPHNLEVHHMNGKFYINFDIEYQHGKSFIEAHDLAEAIEHQIQRDVSSVEKVTIHMEESQHEAKPLADVTQEELTLGEEIRAVVTRNKQVLECTDVTLLKVGNLYNVSVTCMIEKSTQLDEVHSIIGTIERELYQQFDLVRRVTIHAEPA